MKKILFDASVHLGQFDTNDEQKRIWCKNSQIDISENNQKLEIKGYYTYNENGWMDSIIWSLDRKTQDTFYPFMDVFYSVKNIDGLPFDANCLDIFSKLKLKFPDVDDSNLLSSSVAINNKIDEIHSTYDSFHNQELIDYLKGKKVRVYTLDEEAIAEKSFSSEASLEELYQEAYGRFREVKSNLTEKFHS